MATYRFLAGATLLLRHPKPAGNKSWWGMTAAAENELQLKSGSQVAVIGGGPAGSFFAYFLIDLAQRLDLDVQVDVFEPRDFQRPGPRGCNMCAGIISESLI